MATLAPSAAKRLAIAAPMPREPPVMSAILPSSCFDMFLSVHFLDILQSYDSLIGPSFRSQLTPQTLRCNRLVYKYFGNSLPYPTGMGAEWSCGIFVISLRLRRPEVLRSPPKKSCTQRNRL